MAKRQSEHISRQIDRMLALGGDNIRLDGRIEWTCKHGIGHTVGHVNPAQEVGDYGIHGCDGCCSDRAANGK